METVERAVRINLCQAAWQGQRVAVACSHVAGVTFSSFLVGVGIEVGVGVGVKCVH